VANSIRDPSVKVAQTANEDEDGDDQHLQPVKKKKSLKEKKVNKNGRKEKNKSNEISTKDYGSKKKLKSKKRLKREVLDDSP
ncbi:hypothetical protein PanWU01x14_362720, partial [Parasponia andersonii]